MYIKKILFAAVFLIFCLESNAQEVIAYKGKVDTKGQIGANFQNGGTGIWVSGDFGLGKSLSVGFQVDYLLGVQKVDQVKPGFSDRIDLKARLNANIGSVLRLPSNIDIYPGLDLGLKNFGGHFGVRYFFKEGFGLFSELQFPIAKYNPEKEGFYDLNNQFNVSVGASFDL